MTWRVLLALGLLVFTIVADSLVLLAWLHGRGIPLMDTVWLNAITIVVASLVFLHRRLQ